MPYAFPRTRELPGLTREAFVREIVPAARPVVLRGVAAGWAAVAHGRDGPVPLAKYLHGFARGTSVEAWIGDPARGGRFGYTDDLTGFDFARQTLPVGHLFAALMQSVEDAAAPPIYAGALPLSTHFPGLRAEVPAPLLDGRDDLLVSLWLGNGSRTAAHWDLAQNLACPIAGTRRFTLFPPDQIGNLYVGPLDPTPAGQAISLVDIEAPDLARHPHFADALAHAEVAELGPGDALYIPSMWWHHVRAPERFGAQINFWWRDGPPDAPTPLFALMHAMLSVRDLPPPERQAWRALFDHYIFGGANPAAAHLPEAARGILAERDPAARARLSATIADALRD